MNVVGSVLGTPGKSNRYEVLPGQPYDDWDEAAIWVLGVGSGVNDPNVAATLLRHGNYDYVTNSVKWDPGIAEHTLPDSLYLSRLPEWWCKETPWPAIGPDVAGYANKIPAQRRFEGLPCTPTAELTLSGVPADQYNLPDLGGDGHAAGHQHLEDQLRGPACRPALAGQRAAGRDARVYPERGDELRSLPDHAQRAAGGDAHPDRHADGTAERHFAAPAGGDERTVTPSRPSP